MSSYNQHNPLYNFCNKIENRYHSIEWTNESYSEMIGRLCYLIDNAQSIHRSIIGEPIKQEFHYLKFRGQKIPVPGRVEMISPIWGEIEFLTLHHNNYLVNINLADGDGCWTFVGQFLYEGTNGNSGSLLLRTPYVKDQGDEIDLALKFFEPKKEEDREDRDHHDECIQHFFDAYKGNEITFDVWKELQQIQSRYGIPV